MKKRWVAAALFSLSLAGVVAGPPLAGAMGRGGTASPPELEAEPTTAVLTEEAETGSGYTLVAAVSSGSLPAMRAVTVTDVPEEERDAACYAVYRELLTPGESGEFNGEEQVSRAEAVAALYQLSGILVRVNECRYPDVPEEYQDAVAWADSVGISGGVSEARFAPDAPVTRSQLAVMLHRFAKWRGEDVESRLSISGEDIPAYAQEALSWVLDRGLYEGMTEHGLYPALPVSRLQLAEILARLQRDRDPLAASLSLPEKKAVSLSQENHEAIAASIAAAAKKWGAVGVQAAVIENGALTDTYAYGWSVMGKTPMTSEHKLRTASLSKVMVGVSAAILQEEGIIDYDEDISAYWGMDVRNPRRPNTPVTTRSMLTHTSTLLNSESIAWDYNGVRSQLGSASGYGGGTPGSLASWSYNNHAFGILGMTLELASGQYLDSILADRLLTPLGAEGSFAAGELAHPELVSPLYRYGGSLGRSAASLTSVRRWSFPGASGRQFAGGFTTSAADMAKVIAVLAGDGCFEGVRLMDAESVALMESHEWQSAIPGGAFQAMPMRHQLEIYGREGLYYHTGSAYGVYNLVSYDPSTGDGVVVLTMGASGVCDSYGIYAVCGEISKAVYDAIR